MSQIHTPATRAAAHAFADTAELFKVEMAGSALTTAIYLMQEARVDPVLVDQVLAVKQVLAAINHHLEVVG